MRLQCTQLHDTVPIDCNYNLHFMCIHHLAPFPSPDVQALCSVIVWYRPDVPCEGITGYDVRLYTLQSTQQSMTMHVGANATFYIVKAEDRLADNHVQVSLGLVFPLHIPDSFSFTN